MFIDHDSNGNMYIAEDVGVPEPPRMDLGLNLNGYCKEDPNAFNDLINNPSHYTQGIECADYIESHEMDFFQGNAVKYLTRFKLKGTPLEDLQKAEWYVKRLIEQCKKELAKHEKK